MPSGSTPPKGGIASGTVTKLADAGSSYNAVTKGFTNGGTNYVLGVQKGTNADEVEFFYGTSAEVATNNNVECKMTSATWNVVHSGTWSSSNKTYSYNSHTYEIRLQQSSSTVYAEAVQIA